MSRSPRSMSPVDSYTERATVQNTASRQFSVMVCSNFLRAMSFRSGYAYKDNQKVAGLEDEVRRPRRFSAGEATARLFVSLLALDVAFGDLDQPAELVNRAVNLRQC
ncbi:predicted protein [Uncinocarpus reesii 1704]|uniref:Uncharacterized protein n=1 Tax=Uncinocarpus reesii (strain UAMH 1704) TaxID=336963 RepID=C4JNU3_UNCRE|nr:uncharacterized protein UREG_04413 [Uncinocarpus reesii 1704]EEP79567.1 predicted protein [Uncinocarpus reesii 1704]